MTSVRQATIDLFRSHGLTTWFGNPGSSELTLLEDFPEDFRYVLGLQEMVPVGMATTPTPRSPDDPLWSTSTPRQVWATPKARFTTHS